MTLPVPTPEERAEFEAWREAEYPGLSRDLRRKDADAEYTDECAFAAWLASASRTRERTVKKCAAILALLPSGGGETNNEKA
jgi:hypothetical protein